MSTLKRRFYYDVYDGNIFFETNAFSEKSIEEDIATFPILQERSRDSFDMLEINSGDYAQDFEECLGYLVNLDTKQLKFIYPDPNKPDVPIVTDKPLSEQIEQVKLEHAKANYEMINLIMAMSGGLS